MMLIDSDWEKIYISWLMLLNDSDWEMIYISFLMLLNDSDWEMIYISFLMLLNDSDWEKIYISWLVLLNDSDLMQIYTYMFSSSFWNRGKVIWSPGAAFPNLSGNGLGSSNCVYFFATILYNVSTVLEIFNINIIF
jgi:hypothetical protein